MWKQLISDYLKTAKSPLIVILGPTAGGKTGLSVEIVSSLDSARDDRKAEIVNADSRQLYRGLDIGTAKISEEEMQVIPHHLIDMLDPNEEATAGRYQTEAQKVIAEIRERGNVPILVGGSMLYVSTIIDDLTMAPEPDADLRRQIIAEWEKDGGVTLHQRLEKLDPKAAARIDSRNQPRLVRAVEICTLTGEKRDDVIPKEELRCGKDIGVRERCRDVPTGRLYNANEHLILGINPGREILIERINQRSKQMFAAGWIDEVRRLLDQGYTASDPGMKSHGYREIIRFLEEGGPASEEELIEIIASKTREYARRQMSWWRNDKRITWIERSTVRTEL